MNTHTHLRQIVTGTALAFLALPAPAYADGVNAGTLIENTATATYDDGDGPKTVDSNTVVVRVDELLDVTSVSLDAGAVAATPGTAVLAFEVTNTGNGPEAYALTTNPAVAGNEFEVLVEDIAVDTNGNGVYDPGVDEILAAPQTTEVLAADEAITIFVIVTVPNDVTDGQVSSLNLSATAVTGSGTPGDVFAGQGVDGADAIVGSTTALATASGSLQIGLTTVDLTKSFSISDPFGGTSAVPGSVVTFTIVADVTGSGSVNDLVVADIIPDGTTYVAGTLQLDGNPLSDAAGDDAGQASDADGISVDLGTVAATSTQSITFDVTID